MGYQRTWTAFNTESSAYHGGDPGWIRHANTGVISRPSYGRPDLAGVGEYGSEIATGIQALATVAQLAIAAKEQRDAAKRSKQEAATENRRADAAEKRADEESKAQIEQTKAQTQAVQVSAAKGQTPSSKTLLYVGGAVVIGLVAMMLLRRRGAR